MAGCLMRSVYNMDFSEPCQPEIPNHSIKAHHKLPEQCYCRLTRVLFIPTGVLLWTTNVLFIVDYR